MKILPFFYVYYACTNNQFYISLENGTFFLSTIKYLWYSFISNIIHSNVFYTLTAQLQRTQKEQENPAPQKLYEQWYSRFNSGQKCDEMGAQRA